MTWFRRALWDASWFLGTYDTNLIRTEHTKTMTTIAALSAARQWQALRDMFGRAIGQSLIEHGAISGDRPAQQRAPESWLL